MPRASTIGKFSVGTVCPHCHNSQLRKAYNILGSESNFFTECPSCEAVFLNFVPMPHQMTFIKDNAEIKGYFGGFGSAKTSTVGIAVILHMLQIAGGETLIGAYTWPQTRATNQKFILENLPASLIKEDHYKDKTEPRTILKNNHILHYRCLDDEEKLRSMEFTCAWLEEASVIPFPLFAQIKSRLRHPKGVVNGESYYRIFLSSNPDVNWIKDEFLRKSKRIVNYGKHSKEYEVTPKMEAENIYVSYLAPTHLNTYLPANYIQKTSAGMPKWWVDRYINCNFSYSEGLVFPTFNEWICEPFEIPSYWRRFIGIDFGKNDPTAWVFIAQDPVSLVLYQYDEFYSNLNEMTDVQDLGKIFKEKTADIDSEVLANTIVYADPRGRTSLAKNVDSWFDIYNKCGVYPVPAPNGGPNSVGPKLAKQNTLGKRGFLKIFRTCENTIKEGTNYKNKPKELGKDNNVGEKPIDANNHTSDARNYALSDINVVIKDNGKCEIYDKTGVLVGGVKKNRMNKNIYNPLADDTDVIMDDVAFYAYELPC